MSRRYVWHVAALMLLALTQACTSQGSDFVASLKGQLIFLDSSSTTLEWYKLDFSDAAKINKSSKPQIGVLSRDRHWRLQYAKEDTNHDGTIDWHDRSSIYLAQVGSLEKRRVDLPFPVSMCAWGTKDMMAACSFAARDVSPDRSTATDDNDVVYLVDLESGKLLKQLSDPTKTSWALQWSPDGSKLAFQTGIRRENELESEGIQIVNAYTGELVYKIPEPSAREPVWSPDSTRLAFVAFLESGAYTGATIKGMYCDIFHVTVSDTTHTLVNVTRTSRFTQIPAALTHLGGIMIYDLVWSPDGKAIASVWKRDDDEHIWVTGADGDNYAQLTTESGHRYILEEWLP